MKFKSTTLIQPVNPTQSQKGVYYLLALLIVQRTVCIN